jgi:transposase InsO family protein
LKLGPAVVHSRPYHPKSCAENERFNRTPKAEVLVLRRFRDLAEVQRAFDVSGQGARTRGDVAPAA